MSRAVLVINGPNLGRLGRRQPEIYGSTTHDELNALCVRGGAELNLAVEVRQSDHEGELIGWLHEAADAGTPVYFHLHNHGQNTWTFGEVQVEVFAD